MHFRTVGSKNFPPAAGHFPAHHNNLYSVPNRFLSIASLEFLLFWNSSSGILLRDSTVPHSVDSGIQEVPVRPGPCILCVLWRFPLLCRFDDREIPEFPTFHNLGSSERTVSGRFKVTAGVTRFIYNSFLGIQKLFNFSAPFYSSEWVFRIASLSQHKHASRVSRNSWFFGNHIIL